MSLPRGGVSCEYPTEIVRFRCNIQAGVRTFALGIGVFIGSVAVTIATASIALGIAVIAHVID